MCQNKIRKKTLVARLKFWTLGLLFLTLIILFIVPNVTSQPHIDSAKGLTCVKMDFLKQALRMFKLDNLIYPSTKEGLEALLTSPDPKKYPNYVYVNKVPLDAWKNPFIYIHYKTAEEDAFQLISFGADERYGGEGEDADIIYPACLEDEKR